jgi:hypothetical protein
MDFCTVRLSTPHFQSFTHALVDTDPKNLAEVAEKITIGEGHGDPEDTAAIPPEDTAAVPPIVSNTAARVEQLADAPLKGSAAHREWDMTLLEQRYKPVVSFILQYLSRG